MVAARISYRFTAHILSNTLVCSVVYARYMLISG